LTITHGVDNTIISYSGQANFEVQLSGVINLDASDFVF
jgi:hypothetical protein